MKIQRDWANIPPVEDTSTLLGLWRDFEERRDNPDSLVHKYKDDIPRYCYEAPSFDQAIARAVLARRPNGKMHNHQSKQAKILPVWWHALKNNSERRRIMLDVETFDQLYEYLWSWRISGIGPMTVYDTAVRLGEYLGVEPKALYFHAGVEGGLIALVRRGYVNGKLIEHKRKIPMHYLPKPLSNKPADMVEDFLCTYREAILELPSRDES